MTELRRRLLTLCSCLALAQHEDLPMIAAALRGLAASLDRAAFEDSLARYDLGHAAQEAGKGS